MDKKLFQHAEQKGERVFRLKKRRDFVAAARHGKYIKTDYFILQFLKNRSGSLQWGVTAIKKIFKKAPDRNFAKRRLRALFRQRQFFASGNLVLIAVQQTVSADFKTIEKAYEHALERMKKFC